MGSAPILSIFLSRLNLFLLFSHTLIVHCKRLAVTFRIRLVLNCARAVDDTYVQNSIVVSKANPFIALSVCDLEPHCDYVRYKRIFQPLRKKCPWKT